MTNRYHKRRAGHDVLKVKVLAYLRTSTDEQELGIAAQKKEIEKWAIKNQLVIDGFFEDKGVSGTIDPARRPGLALLLARLEKKDIDYVIVHRRDRLGRTVPILGFLEFCFVRYGARLLTVDSDPEEEVTPEKQLLQGVINCMAEYERSLISLRTKAALPAAKDRGVVLGRRKRLSYRSNCILFYVIRWLSERRGCSDEFIQGYLVQELGQKLSLATIARFRTETEVPAFFPIHDCARVLKKYWRISRFER